MKEMRRIISGWLAFCLVLSMLPIPVCMHKVSEGDIYRPGAQNAFGMDKEGQDYRACAAYGPMYKKY